MNDVTVTAPPHRRPNYLYTIISVALVLLLIGLFGLWLLQAAHLSESLKEEIDILVELQDDVSVTDRQSFMSDLEKEVYVRRGSTVFRSKEDAPTEMGDEINQDLVDLDLPNPFRDMVTFNVPADYLQEDSLRTISSSLEQLPLVRDVFYQEKFINRILVNAKRLSFVFLGVALLLVLIAVLLIHNTVRLSLYANRFLIKTQELVGATWSFISRPYLRRALWHGLLSGVIAVSGLVGVQSWLQLQAPELQLFARPIWLAILYGSLLLLGVLISYVSHYSVVRRYLRMRVDDLY